MKVSEVDAPRYRGRKNFPTQNVSACSFDMIFTYILPGWEGTASDSRILKNALSREDRLIIPRGILVYEHIRLEKLIFSLNLLLNIFLFSRKILSCGWRLHVKKWTYYSI